MNDRGARGSNTYLRVHHNSFSLLNISRFVEENGAKTISVAHNRNAGIMLDAPDKFLTAARDH